MAHKDVFEKDEILGKGKNWIAVQNSATNDLQRVSRHNYNGKDYVITDKRVNVGSYCAGVLNVGEFMKEEKIYRVASENYLNGLGTKLVVVSDKRKVKAILEDIKQDVKRRIRVAGLDD